MAEGVVESVINRLRQNAQPGSGVTVDHQVCFQAIRLLIAGYIAHLRQGAQFVHQLGSDDCQFLRIGIFHGVLILRSAHTAFHGQILHRLHVEHDPCNLAQLWLQSADDLTGSSIALIARL